MTNQIEEIKRQAELAKHFIANPNADSDFYADKFAHTIIAANELLQQDELFPKGKWLPIEKGYYDAEVYLCYFPENKGVEKYKAHGLLSVAKTKGATHYMIPQPPKDTK